MKKLFPFILIGIILLLGGGFLAMYIMRSNNSDFMNHYISTQSHRSYTIEVTQKPNADEIILNEPTTIKYKIKNDKGEILKAFATPHEKLMHFIIIRKDLIQFQHLHPIFDKNTGEFSVDVIFTVDGPYRFFADFTPANGQKGPDGNYFGVTSSFDMNVGDVSNFQPHPVTPTTQTELIVPPDYQVAYSFPNNLNSQELVTYSLTVEKNNQPITLEKYLGALGHSVILKEGTLDYIHTHAGGYSLDSMQQEQAANKIDFTTTFPEAGIYRIFTQFKHQEKVLISEYTIDIK